MEASSGPGSRPPGDPPRFPVDTAFDTALFALIAMSLILGPVLVAAGYELGPEPLDGARRWYQLGLVLSFGIALPALVVYNLTEGAWVVEPGPPRSLAWRRRLGPVTVPGVRLGPALLGPVAVGGHVSKVTRGNRTEDEWSYQAFVTTRDGRLYPAGGIHKGHPGGADAEARALAAALGVTARTASDRRGIGMERTPTGEWVVATRPGGTETGWAEILAVLGTMLAFFAFIASFVTR